MANRLDSAPTIKDPHSIEGAIDVKYAAASDALAIRRLKQSKKIAKRQLRGVGRSIKINGSGNNNSNTNSSSSFGNSYDSAGETSNISNNRNYNKHTFGNGFGSSEEASYSYLPLRHDPICKNTNKKLLNSMLGMASRLEKSHALEDPSIVKGAPNTQYWKNVRGNQIADVNRNV